MTRDNGAARYVIVVLVVVLIIAANSIDDPCRGRRGRCRGYFGPLHRLHDDGGDVMQIRFRLPYSRRSLISVSIPFLRLVSILFRIDFRNVAVALIPSTSGTKSLIVNV